MHFSLYAFTYFYLTDDISTKLTISYKATSKKSLRDVMYHVPTQSCFKYITRTVVRRIYTPSCPRVSACRRSFSGGAKPGTTYILPLSGVSLLRSLNPLGYWTCPFFAARVLITEYRLPLLNFYPCPPSSSALPVPFPYFVLYCVRAGYQS
ncbi:hypothetical protein SAMN06265379_104111 [Saccharicrinis carchari]|uniref:Uncharacterized protein n=1 Tax=Saccharicrinis carchari TaxID=1168039 RepID=A0A521D1E9_SACCC|nr:hypothetical protein SAMN06265379_104111 [Saccharicrinis carchari]